MNIKRIESILATAIFLFILILIYGNNIRLEMWYLSAMMAYAAVIYTAFMVFTQWISPAFFRQRKIEGGTILTLAFFFAIWAALAGCIWMAEYKPGDYNEFWPHLVRGDSLGVACLTFLLIFAYEGVKLLARYAREAKRTLRSRIAKESLIVLGSGVLVFFLLLSVEKDLAVLWLTAIPYAYLLFALNTYWLIPQCESRREGLPRYLVAAVLLSILVFLPFGVIFVNIANARAFVAFLEWFCITLVVLPLSYYVFQQQKEHIAQLVNLKIELGQASADLNFLRSQINPHFLFNILNTLYGTALQENAGRTSSGIQKLGDMMRFMLHENTQDKILLGREIDYLRNYIDLQQLRTATSRHISIECDIRDVMEGTYIAPMLLIPFVENAFKHGISLQEKSWIRISLYESEGKLFFDVHNSIHARSAADPEKHHPGIGLENVKQRLAMLYPQRHELVIRQNSLEFFVHLTLYLQ